MLLNNLHIQSIPFFFSTERKKPSLGRPTRRPHGENPQTGRGPPKRGPLVDRRRPRGREGARPQEGGHSLGALHSLHAGRAGDHGRLDHHQEGAQEDHGLTAVASRPQLEPLPAHC